MSSVAYLKPKSTGTQTLDFVWANDANAHIVDISATTQNTVISKKLNANDPKNGLTQSVDENGDKIVGQWTNALGQIYKYDVSGTDINGALFVKSFYVANGDGLQTLTRVGTTGDKFSFPIGDLVNKLFTDQNGTPYLTSYNNNVPKTLQRTTDLSLTTVIYNNTDNISNNDFSNSTWTDNSNNKIIIDCSSFSVHPSSVDSSYNPVNVDTSLNLRTQFVMTSYTVANTDISNRLIVNMYKMGVGSTASTTTKFSSPSVQNTFIDLSVNVLNIGSSLVIETNGTQVINAQSTNLQPNVDLINLLPNTYVFTKTGRQNVRFPITINSGVSGQWIWSVYLKDGNMQSSAIDVTLKIMPSFSAPIVTLTGETLLYQDTSFNVNLKVDDVNFNPDICGNLPRGLMLRPRINAVDSLIAADNTAVNIDRLINLTYNNNVVRTPLDVTDLCLNKFTFADVSNSYVSGLVVTTADISNNEGIYSKRRDVSTNIIISNVDDISQCNLPSRSFKMFVDWLPNAEPTASSTITPQTLSIGEFTIATAYSSNVIITTNKDGTTSLSLSDNNGNLSGANYRVRVFTTEKCDTPATSNVTLDVQPNVDKTTASPALSQYDFRVKFDSNNEATFVGPKLVANTSQKTNFMVAYLEKDSNVYLYTASNKVGFTKTNFPSIDLEFDTVTAFTAADINKIINVDDNLDLNTNLADLSGYAIKGIDYGFDLSCNLNLPSWSRSINSPTLTFTVNDTNNVVKSFDISGSLSKKSSIANSIVFNNISDLSDNGVFRIDLSYNSVKTPCLFSMNIVFADADKNDYAKANKSVVFYYTGEYAATVANAGGKQNTLLVYNDTKYIIDNKLDSTRMILPAVDSYNTYSWLAGSSSNSYVLDLARSEFVGTGHVLDISYFNINTSSSKVSGSDSANINIGFSGDWTRVKTGGNAAWTSADPQVSNDPDIISSFARTNFSWIDTKKFVGTIDIDYKTKDSNKSISTTVNKLRLVVVPRPNLTLSVATTPNVLVNTKANITATVTNIAQNKAGTAITDVATWNPVDISGSKPLIGKLRNVMSVNSGAISLVTKAGTPDIANSSFFVIPSVGTLLYGQVAMPVISFNGRSTAGLVSSNVRATYSAFGSKSVQSLITELTVAVYSTDSAFNNSTYTNNLYANNSINFQGMPFVQYVTLDNSFNTIALHTDTRTKNAAFVVVENKGSVTSAAITANTLTGTTTVVAGGINVYQHAYTSGSNTTWTFLYSKQN